MPVNPNDSYLALVLSKSYLADNMIAVFSLLFLFFARFFPIMALSPFFGSKVLPHPTKVTMGLAMFVIFLPQLITVVTEPIKFNPYLVLLLGKELFVGTLLGFVISLPFTIAQNAGIIIDHQRGGASLMVNDPTIQNQSSPLGTLFNMVLIVIFFLVNGPFLFLNAIITSYEIIPPDQFINGNLFANGSSLWDFMVQVFNQVMVISMQLASPALLAILMTDVFLGIANRLAPQVQITFLGMPLKSLLALVVVCFGWRLFSEELARQCHKWLDTVTEVLKMVSAAGP